MIQLLINCALAVDAPAPDLRSDPAQGASPWSSAAVPQIKPAVHMRHQLSMQRDKKQTYFGFGTEHTLGYAPATDEPHMPHAPRVTTACHPLFRSSGGDGTRWLGRTSRRWETRLGGFSVHGSCFVNKQKRYPAHAGQPDPQHVGWLHRVGAYGACNWPD